ncbi:proteasome subunit beta type-4 [Lycorma delicatula]|uniref:proteasome subunit beta type-4 n=1 Tax=Lycorma delicatula TaxID=130591 RepID=UPI003F51A735
MSFNASSLDPFRIEFPYSSHNRVITPQMDYIKRTQNPVITGTSVIGIKFNKGVMVAADMLGSFGSLAKFRKVDRIMEVNKQIIMGAGGDYADFQYLSDIIKQKVIDESCMDDGFLLKPKSLHCWITRVLYNRRSKFDPLWTSFIVGGLQDGKPFLGTVDKIGTAYEDDCIATGYGSYLAIPLMREALEKNKNLSEQEAADIIENCMQVLFYRDARSLEKYQLATVTEEGVKISDPITVKTNWDIAKYVSGYE